MLNKLVEKIYKISETKVKEEAKIYDKKSSFPEYILNFLNETDLKLLLGYHSNFKTINYHDEAKFYYHASKYCSNIRNYFLVSIGMVGAGVFKFGTHKQKNEYIKNITKNKAIFSLAITEKNAGSDINSIRTTYKFKNNKFIINGTKTWITLGGKAKFFLLLANGEKGLILFFVKKNKSIQTKLLKGIISNKGSFISELKINNLILKKEDILGGDAKYTLSILEYILINGRSIASMAGAAMSEAALEEAINFSKERIQFGKRIFQYQQIQEIFSNASVEIESLKLLSSKSFEIKRKNINKGKFYANVAKFKSSKVINQTTSKLMEVFGANSNSNKFNIERYDREAKAFMFIEGTSQIISQLISSYLIMKY